jgi:hypothetical protein
VLTSYILGVITLILRASYLHGTEDEEDFDKDNRLGSRIGAAIIWPILALPYIAHRIGEKEKERSKLPEAKVYRRLK